MKFKKNRLKSIFKYSGIVIAASILTVIAADSVYLDKLCAEQGGKRDGNNCFIQTAMKTYSDPESEHAEFTQFENAFTMEPNSVKFFYYPDPDNTENRDPFDRYMIIRLSEWLGGDVIDASAYRAYSMMSVDDGCLVRYWEDAGRQRIENPCSGGFYRVIDGAMTIPYKSMFNSHPIGLPHLDLSIGDDGFLYVEPPSFTKTENGVLGYGKEMTRSEVLLGSKFLKQKFEESFPSYPEIPLDLAGLLLADIAREKKGFVLRYSEFSAIYDIPHVSILKCDCDDNLKGYISKYMTNDHSQFQEIGNTIIVLNGSTPRDQHNQTFFMNFDVGFVKDGYQFLIVGKTLDELKHDLILNYFPEYAVGDFTPYSDNL